MIVDAYEGSAHLAPPLQACHDMRFTVENWKSLEWTVDVQDICLLEGLLFGLIILCVSNFEY